MNRFSVLNVDSDDEEMSIISEISLEKVEEVAHDENSLSLPLTVINLTSHANRTSTSDSHVEKVAKERLFDLTKIYWKITPFNKLKSHRLFDFVKYMSPKAKVFFDKFVHVTDGGWQGEFGSIWSWKYDFDEFGKPIYLYVTSIESYGSCSGCDGFLSLNDHIQYNVWEVDCLIEETLKVKGNDLMIIKDKIREIIHKTRSLVENFVRNNISQLKIFTNYYEACNYLKSHIDFDMKLPNLKTILAEKYGKIQPKKVQKPFAINVESFAEFPPIV